MAAGAIGRVLLPWLPLMHGGGESAIIERWKELAMQEIAGRCAAPGPFRPCPLQCTCSDFTAMLFVPPEAIPTSSRRQMNGLFFTGTDTGVGKTFVLAAVAQTLRRRGKRFCVSKPVATGAAWQDGFWLSDDTRQLAMAAADWDYAAITPWAFAEAAAPPVAARLAGVTLSLSEIVAAVRRRADSVDLLLIEGIGGLLCPLTERETIADLAAALPLPLIVVTRRSLGTLNHTLLTVEAAQQRGLPIAGVIVNETAPVLSVAEQTNVEELRKRLDVPLLAVVPYQAPEAAGLEQIDWQRLAQGQQDSD
jgi:dethiobiotin synthetase